MSDDHKSRGPRTRWAERRTAWAEDRTVLANERTFSGWTRSGMTAVALAIGMNALFGSIEPGWLTKTVASFFIGVGVLMFIFARGNAVKTLNRLNDHRAEPLSSRQCNALSGLLIAGSLAVCVLLWMI